MKKLDKKTLEKLATMRAKIETAHAEAQQASYDLNDRLSHVRDAIEDYNAGLLEAAATVRAYTSGRSVKWRESEASDAHGIWIDELESATLDADEPEDVEIADLDFPELPELGS